MDYCQDCGRLLLGDMRGFDDVASGPYVTESGDVFCIPCGRAIDQEEQEMEEDPYA